MEKVELRPYEITSLPPGFIVIRVPHDERLSEIRCPDWEEMKKKGYSGGIIVYGDINIESLDDKLMADLGWVREESGGVRDE